MPYELTTGYTAALGRLGLSAINKFGHQGAVGTTLIAIWDRASDLNYLAAAASVNVTSSDANDTSAGTGARTITVSGLDANYDEISESVTLNGQTIVATTALFLRIFRVVVDTAGSGLTNAGIIYTFTGTETAGVPDDATLICSQILAAEAQTLMAVYTVPRDKRAMMRNLLVTGDSSKTVTIKLMSRPLGGVFNTKDKFLITAGNMLISHPVPPVFDERTDIQVCGMVSVGTTEVSASFDLVLVPKR